MQKFLLLYIGVFLIGFSPAQARAQFFETLPDVPKMSGLVELSERAISFDKPEGRISESVAVVNAGAVSRFNITKFYADSLPQLGWRSIGDLSYVRQNEKLSLRFEEFEGLLYVHFMVAPQK